MEIVKTSRRIIFMLITLISFISVVFLYLGYVNQKFVLSVIVDEERKVASKIYSNTFKLITRHYESVARNIISNKEIVKALENNDRAKLLELTAPVYKDLQEQNPYLNIMHFHTKDSRSFLRLHKPSKFGDSLRDFRHMVNKVNKTKEKLVSIEVGRYGIYHRLALPVFNQKGKHIGSFEFGIDINYIFKIFDDEYNVESILFLNNDNFNIIYENNDKIEYQSFSDKYYVIEPRKNDIISCFDTSVVSKDHSIVEYKDSTNLIFTVKELKSIKDEDIGKIVLVKNMSFYTDKVSIIRNISIILALLLIAISYYLLKRIFNNYIHTIQNYQSQLEIKNRTLSKLSNIDHLTKVNNRRSIERVLSQELKRAKRYSKPISILMFDIDDFKLINDTYGHNVGDKVLRTISKLITSMIRESDYFGRWGGEEFLLIATETSIEDAKILAEKIRKNIEEYDFDEPKNITCSIGLTQLDSLDDNLETLVHKADGALYKAKNSGKNQTQTYI